MATETLKLTSYPFGAPSETMVVTVEYREVPHFYTNAVEKGLKRYEVLVDGEVVGTVHSFEYHSHTTYKGTMIRRDLGTPKRWAWRGADGRSENFPGLYASTRRRAVSSMLGYDRSERVVA